LTPHLLDVNVLVAIQWEQDKSHKTVFDWFSRTGVHSFVTCAVTQTSWLRLMMNPSFPGQKASMQEARAAMLNLTQLEGHTFWEAAPAYEDIVAPFVRRILGHRQITDAYLLGLAILNRGVLVTRDKAIPHLAGAEHQKHVVLL